MRIGIPIKEQNDNTSLDDRFGRSPHFCIYDTEDSSISFFTNQFITEKNAGNKISKLLLEENVDFVIAKKVGHKTFNKLTNFKIKVYKSKSNHILTDIIYDELTRYSTYVLYQTEVTPLLKSISYMFSISLRNIFQNTL